MKLDKKITEWEVLTPDGWSDFDGIKKTTKPSIVELIFDTGEVLLCSKEHKIKLLNGKFLFSNKIKVGDLLFGDIMVVSKKTIKGKIDLYDLLNVKKENQFYTNGVVSHNCAHIDKFDEIWTGLHPTISTGGCAILSSSPKGTGQFFHEWWVQARAGENNFNCKYGNYINPTNPNESYDDRLMWWVHPEHDLAWFQNETKGKAPRDIAQEYECSFNSSGDTFIYADNIIDLEKSTTVAKKSFHLDRNVWIWEDPIKEGTYLIPCDVSRGDAKDFSAFHVLRLDVHPIRQVAEYKGKIKPDLLGNLLVAVSQLYNNASIAPENNSGWSGQTILKIEEAGHPFLYYSRKRRSAVRDQMPVDPYYAAGNSDFLPGYAVTSANRIQMLAKLEQYVRAGDIEINSPRLIEEFKTFIITDSNRPEAMRGYNDDLVMSLAGGIWIREEAFLNIYRSDDMSKAMLAGMSTNNTSTKNYKDFNYQSTSIYDRGRIVEHYNEKHQVKLGSGEIEDISWLITKG